MSNEFHLRDPTNTLPRTKSPPKSSSIPVPFSYVPSDDGTDENLVVFLHGLGDTHLPFFKLASQLKLPQSAVLALRAPEQVPFLYEESYQWYPSFDDLGEIIERPNPTPALDLLSIVFAHLVNDCGWPAYRLHLFGFAQGGSVAAEFGVRWWKQQSKRLQDSSSSSHQPNQSSLGSIITISGPLLSYPTLTSISPTPLLVIHRPAPAESALPSGSLVAYKKAYENVIEHRMGHKGAGMPASKSEWEPIMRFWSEKLGRRQVEGLYEVMSGFAAPQESGDINENVTTK